MPPASRPQWQKATALITIGAGGITTGISFLPRTPAELTSPASVPPVTLLALEHASGPAVGSDAMLRAAIVHIARHFLRLAQTRSPAEMEAMIWQYASTDGANHGPSCAAFASLTLELGSHVAGLDSWVTGGTSYPWQVHSWVDSRVDPNPASPGVVSVLQDAQNHGRWHPLGDRYAPKPGDWVLFGGHVEVVTKYQSGVLHTIGGDSLPNLSVNAHEYSGPLQDQGVAGFVDNGVGMSNAPAQAANAGGGPRHAGRAKVRPARQASAAPTSAADRSPAAGTASAGTAASGSPAGGSPAGGSPAGASPVGAGPASSAGPVSTADATGQQPELEPHAIAAPPAVPRSRYAPGSRALSEQGARPQPASTLRVLGQRREQRSPRRRPRNRSARAGTSRVCRRPAPAGRRDRASSARSTPAAPGPWPQTSRRRDCGQPGPTGPGQARQPSPGCSSGRTSTTRALAARYPPTTATTRRRMARPCQARPPSRALSSRSQAAPWPRSASTAYRPRSPSRRRSTSPAGARASWRPTTTTCSGSREPVRRAATCCRRRR